ncbi:MAG: DUF2784 domain-containing protein, partial [Deltaproteobacteria bacterium]|nr:DUF2784 domain-containing protein [Deltaproteobacteria bacterium]
MDEAAMYQWMADIILIIHAMFIGFVVQGLVLIFVGGFFGWAWVRNLWFRIGHLLAIGFVVTEAWWGQDCPLTIWENSLRKAGGGVTYSGTFIQYWLQRLIFYDFPPWVFTAAYTAFCFLVLLAWIWMPPKVSRMGK